MPSLGWAEALIVSIIGAIAIAQFVGLWKIVAKAGFSGALSLLWLVPVVNLVFFFLFAFSEWPIQKELRRLKGTAPPPPQALGG